MDDDDSFDDYDVDDEGDPTAPCRNCGQPVYDDSPRCPYCGDYDPHGGRAWAWSHKPRWLVWTAVILVLATAFVFAWPFISMLLQLGR